MCGISGAFSFHPDALVPDIAVVRGINDSQRARGPDGDGVWRASSLRVTLGHRRLAIIDIGPSGAQPMSDTTGRWVITFNGEIYNYRELRRELESDGVRFLTNCDTEVVINAIALWGEAGLRKLHGMFAFGLWDDQQQELWLARDPYGIKPLYMAESGGILWFASQAKALVRHAPVDKSRDPAGLVGFYCWGHIPEPFTWWSGISMLPAGHYRRIKNWATTLEPSQQFCSIETLFCTDAELSSDIDYVREALIDTVRYHLVSDVPVGIFLSAGIDSNVIATLATKIAPHIQTITLTFDEYKDSSLDEASIAQRMAKSLGTRHTTVTITRDEFFAHYERFFEAMDQPSIDGLNTYLISYAAASLGFKVVLSGLGGDELFGGYPSFRQIPFLLKFRHLLPISDSATKIIEKSLRMLPLRSSPKMAAALSHSKDLSHAYLLRRCLHTDAELKLLLDEAWIDSGLERLQTTQKLQETIMPLSQRGYTAYAQIAALESCWYMRNQLLRDADWASMAHGLELRVPFADVQLLSKLAPLIVSSKPPGKDILAETALTPTSELLKRPKTGFTTPIRDWISNDTGAARGLRSWASAVHRQFKAI
jgi:asparagine synthase (glutamine-hydrolysing)